MHAKKSLSEKINNEKITGLLCVSPFIFGFFLFFARAHGHFPLLCLL